MERPSDNRCAALKNTHSKRTFSNLSNRDTIQRYYQVAKNIKKRHEEALMANRLDDAYVIGLRFANLSMDGLPTHDVYNVKILELFQQWQENEQDLNTAMSQLEQIVMLMDLEELEKR